MDLKLIGFSCLTLASFSFLVFDYLTYKPAPQTSNGLIHPFEGEITNAPVVPHPPPSLATQIPAAADAQVTAKQRATNEIPTPNLSHFAHPTVTGFLSPDGFTRPSWKPQTSGLEISATPLETQRFVVMLDPGHGGTDPGAMSHNGLVEKHLTLDIAQRTRLYLSKYPNIDVVFTRETDKGLSRDSRVQKIKKSSADLLISLHFNHLPQTNIAVVETYYADRHNIKESLAKQREDGKVPTHNFRADQQHHSSKLSFTQSSQKLASILQQHMFTEVRSANSNAENAGVKKDTLFVLTRSYMPSALIEITCLSNPTEAIGLMTNEYRNRLSSALANGILEYRQTTINTGLIDPGKNDRSPDRIRLSPTTNDTEKNT
ncbi:MAG: N-acetylmuramoyl-L-alanine amidase [Granulosicoccus sp.]|jgi:N-acetylmuramoyl-L-alanine amidase